MFHWSKKRTSLVHVNRGPSAFWLLVVTLFSASLFFGVTAERQRRSVRPAEVALQTGDLVQLAQVVDGDTVLVKTQGGQLVTVRLIGIKAFATKPDKDPASVFGKSAMDELDRLLRDQPIRIMVSDVPRDKHGRLLAELFVGDHDVSVALLRQGLALVYSAYPFHSMPLFLHEQEMARAERKGLWAVPELAKRADSMIQQWSREVP